MNLSKNGLGIALLVSLAINLLIVGAIGGMAMAGLRHDAPPVPTMSPPPATRFQFNPRAFIRALPVDERRKAMRVMRGAAGEHRQLSRAMQQTRRELGQLLIAEKLDKAKIESHFDRLLKLETEIRKLGQPIIIKILDDLDLQTRRQVIKAAGRRPASPRQNRPGRRQAPRN